MKAVGAMVDDSDLDRIADTLEHRFTDALEHRFDDRYRKIDDCTDIMTQYDSKLDKVINNQTAEKTRLNILIAILAAIAAPVIGTAVTSLLGG